MVVASTSMLATGWLGGDRCPFGVAGSLSSDTLHRSDRHGFTAPWSHGALLTRPGRARASPSGGPASIRERRIHVRCDSL